MNKDVIYVEPEDDITDIILKIENSKEKIVALVPPKKAGVFRSVVNIKLIAKSGKTADKKIVLVTVDPSIVRLAAAAKLPVTKNLQTAPSVPEVSEEPEALKAESLVEESDGEVETEEDVEELLGEDEDDDSEDDEEKEKADEEKKGSKAKDEKDQDEEDGEEKPAKKKAEKPTKNRGKFAEWFSAHKKLVIFGGIGVLGLIVFLVWAFAIAPAVTVTVGVKATSNNFSEAVSFTSNMNEESASEGKFYLEEKKIEDIKEVEFEATGKKNVGEKASGEIYVYYYFPIDGDGGEIPVNSGTTFTINGLSYVSGKSVTIQWDGDLDTLSKDCENYTDKASLKNSGCMVSKKIEVTATEPGSKYNIGVEKSGWTTVAPVGVYSDKAMSGGTDAEITVVQQSDIDKAKEQLAVADENANKQKLLEGISENSLVIDSSFSQTTGEAISTPGVGEEVKSGEKAKLKAVTTSSIKILDKTKVEEFIAKKAELKENQEIYEVKNPFIENFSQTTGGYTGKLKTTYLTGPKVTVSSIVELVKGKGIGDAQHALKDIDGIADVRIQGSYPWVMSVPGDTNKINVNIEVKDQNGDSVKIDTDKDTEKVEEKTEGEEKSNDSKE
ncbi:hypothetical protein IKE99_01895 [Candidatus Saccharibacteria bacterium]|nr:hypothetical protein [Candidatus Saccharibacteria bacterium]